MEEMLWVANSLYILYDFNMKSAMNTLNEERK